MKRQTEKNKVFSILLAFTMIILMLPTHVFADVSDGYVVFQSTDLSTPAATVSTLTDAFAYINANAAADTWVIKVTGNDSAVGAAAALNASGATVTLTSEGGNPFTLYQTTSSVRHISITAGTLVLENITLDGSSAGGGIVMADNAAITMNSNATIQNCKAPQGGGVYCGGNGTLTMNDGSTISGCQSTFNGTGGSGAGICSTGTVILNDGCKISENTANGGKGGGIAMCYGNALLTMNGGEISNNQVLGYSSDYLGGGVALYGGSTFKMYGGKITGNKADIGGGICLWDFGGYGSNFTMYDGELSNNDTTFTGYHCYGGGIFAWSYAACAVDIEGGEIYSNSAKQGGGIMTYDGSAFVVNEDASIRNNSATWGGGIFSTSSSGSVNDSASIHDNTATYGGGVYVNLGTFSMNDTSSVHDNTATFGGGIYARTGLIMRNNTLIEKNSASAQGGGVFLYNTADFSMSGGTITENTSGTYGGGVSLYGKDAACKFTMDPSGAPKIYQNTAAQAADDVYGNGTNTNITLISVADMQLPSSITASDWFVDAEGARYRDPAAAKTVYSVPSGGIADTVFLTIGIQYSITYDANGGSGNRQDTVYPGVTYTVLSSEDAAIRYTGFVFAGWNTSADGSGDAYQAGDTFVPESNQTLFAQWTAIPCTVTFDPNGGSVTPTTATTETDGTLSSLPTPTRTGSYTFDGWYTTADGGTQITADTVFVKDTTVFAHWTYHDNTSISDQTPPLGDNTPGTDQTGTDIGDTQTPLDGGNQPNQDVPQTGDASNLLLWALVMALSGIGLGMLCLLPFKKNDPNAR